jgi:transposase, IS6 family
MNTSTPFKWRHFQAASILLCVRWYLRYPTRLPRPGGDDGRRGVYLSITRRSSGFSAMRRAPAGEALSSSSQDDERLVARRRDVGESEKGRDGPLSRRGFARVRPWNFSWAPGVMRKRPNASSRKRWRRLLAALLASSPVLKTPPSHKPGSELKAERIMPDACELRQSTYLNNLGEQDHRAHQTVGQGRRWASCACETAWRTRAADMK